MVLKTMPGWFYIPVIILGLEITIDNIHTKESTLLKTKLLLSEETHLLLLPSVRIKNYHCPSDAVNGCSLIVS